MIHVRTDKNIRTGEDEEKWRRCCQTEPERFWPSWRSSVFLQTSSCRSGVGGPNLWARQPAWEPTETWTHVEKTLNWDWMCERLSFSSLWYLTFKLRFMCVGIVNINMCWRTRRSWRVNDRMNKHWLALKRRTWRVRLTWETRSGWTVCSLRRWSNDRCPAAPNPSCHRTRRSGSCKHTRTHRRRLLKLCFS